MFCQFQSASLLQMAQVILLRSLAVEANLLLRRQLLLSSAVVLVGVRIAFCCGTVPFAQALHLRRLLDQLFLRFGIPPVIAPSDP